MKTLTLDTASVIELKAAVYDLQKRQQLIQGQINAVEREIRHREEAEKPPVESA